jgi:predicted RNA binding protein YcfA (HicA-like mRNA interferase family)
MPPVGPVSRLDLIRGLRRLGFEGPLAGSRHETMRRGSVTLWIPNPHGSDISAGLLLRILRQAGVSRDEWERL